jgi:hypothetical protein
MHQATKSDHFVGCVNLALEMIFVAFFVVKAINIEIKKVKTKFLPFIEILSDYFELTEYSASLILIF